MATAPAQPTPLPPDVLESTPPEVKCYERQKLTASISSTLLTLAVLAVLALAVSPRLDAVLRGWLGDNPWLRLITLAFLYAVLIEALTLPFAFYTGYVLEHRYQLSNQSFRGWVWKHVKGWLLGGVLGLVLVLGLYTLLWYGGAWWWVWATVAWLGVTLVLGQLLPVVILPLFYKVTPLEDTTLADRLRRLAEGTGLQIEGVYRLHLSSETKKANAALAGLGRTRRVLLGDTLLDQFSPEEIDVVFAHEVGHHVYRHLPKLVAWSVVIAALGFWLVDLVLRHSTTALGYSGFDDPAALPLVLLVLSVLGLVLTPLQNALSRFFEWQCDSYALKRTGTADAYRSAFIKLARLNKVDPDPHPLVVWLFDDHPPIRQRLRLAEQVTG
jgi:STE24 endopeptidase